MQRGFEKRWMQRYEGSETSRFISCSRKTADIPQWSLHIFNLPFISSLRSEVCGAYFSGLAKEPGERQYKLITTRGLRSASAPSGCSSCMDMHQGEHGSRSGCHTGVRVAASRFSRRVSLCCPRAGIEFTPARRPESGRANFLPHQLSNRLGARAPQVLSSIAFFASSAFAPPFFLFLFLRHFCLFSFLVSGGFFCSLQRAIAHQKESHSQEFVSFLTAPNQGKKTLSGAKERKERRTNVPKQQPTGTTGRRGTSRTNKDTKERKTGKDSRARNRTIRVCTAAGGLGTRRSPTRQRRTQRLLPSIGAAFGRPAPTQ
jgi:hypothetical protein